MMLSLAENFTGKVVLYPPATLSQFVMLDVNVGQVINIIWFDFIKV